MYIDNARLPKGILGRIMLTRMNRGTHARLAEWALGLFDQGERTLDVGCGGGANIARMLARGGKVYGLDYSPVSVSKSARHNRKAVKAGRCEIVRGDVTAMPFDDCAFDMVTAFETVYFWQPIEAAFAEVFRVLEAGGRFGVFRPVPIAVAPRLTSSSSSAVRWMFFTSSFSRMLKARNS